MGILKHAILPILCIPHGVSFFFWISGNRTSHPVMDDFPSAAEGFTEFETALLGKNCAFHGSMLFACLVGIFHEDSHFRGILIVMESIAWVCKLLDSYMLGNPLGVLSVFAALSVGGMLVHANEPGIFSKDKNKES